MPDIENNQALKVIFSRKSVREFTGESIDINFLEVIFKAGMAAPSASTANISER